VPCRTCWASHRRLSVSKYLQPAHAFPPTRHGISGVPLAFWSGLFSGRCARFRTLLWSRRGCGGSPHKDDGWSMRHVVVLAVAGIGLAGCSSFSLPSMDLFTPAPPVITLQLDSRPEGATAATSAGASCRTPCALQVAATPALTVTYTLERYLPQSVTLQTGQHQGPPNSDGTAPIVTDFDQNPVFVELQPAIPPKKMRKPPPKKHVARLRPPPPAAAAEAPPSSASASSQFPAPAPASR